MSTRISKVALRRADLKDSSHVLAWRNESEAIRLSVSGLAVEDELHRRWFEEALESSNILMLIAESELKGCIQPVGMCRFDLVKAGVFSVSINVGPDFRGRGFGETILQSAITFLNREVGEPAAIEAVVHESNSPSLRVFEKTGFSVFARGVPWLHLRLAPNASNEEFT